jgi:hypothetical protein
MVIICIFFFYSRLLFFLFFHVCCENDFQTGTMKRYSFLDSVLLFVFITDVLLEGGVFFKGLPEEDGLMRGWEW